MASQIELILDDIATWTPTYDSDVSIPIWNIDDVKQNIQMRTPRRVLMALEEGIAGERFEFASLGVSMRTIWRIRDRLYLAPVGELASLRRWHGPLVRYVADYIEDIRTNRSPVAQAKINGATARVGVFEWAEGERYFGVDIDLEIEEVHN